MSTKVKIFFAVVGGIFLLDIALINWKMFSNPSNASIPIPIVENFVDKVKKQEPSVSGPICSSGCLQKIKEATASLQVSVDQLQESTNVQKPTVTQSVGSLQNAVSEFFIPLGSGSTTKNNWTTLSGLEAQINSANYAGITKVYFEASLRIPTGNGRLEARLINLSDNTPLAETEVYVEGNKGKRVERQFALRSGNKVYGVQLKSSLEFLGILDLARIKIVTN